MAWASEDAENYLSVLGGIYLQVAPPKFASRNASMYVDFKGDLVVAPQEVISRADADAIIQTVNVALQRIREVTDFWGHQIGTKGFMK